MDKLITVNGARILYNDTRSRIDKVNTDLNDLDLRKVDGAKVSEDGKYLYLTANGEDVTGPLGPFSGGGGGGGGSDNNAVLTLTNYTSWGISTSIAEGSQCLIKFEWSSTEDDIPTGPGSLSIKVGGITKKSQSIEQGVQVVDISEFLSLGLNTVKVSVSDIYENTKSINFRVTTTAFSLTSKFDDSQAYESDINFSYTAKGEGEKEMHFLLDGVEFLTKTITTTGREDIIIIPRASELYPEGFKWHGSHVLTCYFTAVVEGSEVRSNELRYDLICYTESDTTPIITSSFVLEEVQQYDTLIIPYYVYKTTSSYSNVELYVNGKLEAALEGVPRNLQTWTYKASSREDLTFAIKCEEVEKTFFVRVKAVDVDVHAETKNLVLHLNAEGRSNQEPSEKRAIWEFEDIRANLTGFNWNTDGWLKDEKGLSIMRVKDTARVEIPYQPFSTSYRDIKTTGKTIEFEFATSGVFDYDTEIISCFSEGRGFRITAQQALISSSISSLRTQYKENEHVRISFVISKTANDRLMYCYINGIISGLVQYPSTTIFYQNPSVDIKIGSSDAVVDVYRIRIYDNDLSRFQMINNWIADMQDGRELLDQYQRNNIYNDSDEIDLKKVQANLPTLPYMILDIDGITDKKGNPMGHLPKYKGQKLLVSGSYTDPVEPRNSFSFKNAEIDVQGTSSQAYPIKNFKIKNKPAKTYGTEEQQPTDCSGFIMTYESEKQGKEVCIKKYSMRGYSKYDGKYKDAQALSIPTNTFVFKADYASSEGANNVELVRFYNDTCPYRTPAQSKDSRARQGIDGFPMIWFGTSGGKTSFIGKYNFNNHKGTDEVYGLDYHGETYEEDDVSDYHRTVVGATDESWEVTDNNSEIALWKRLAGDNTKTILKDKDGNEVTYDKYIVDENLVVVKNITLYPLFNDTYDHSKIEDIDTYLKWQKEWKEKYADAEDWINELALLKIHDAGESMPEEIRDQRNFVISLMKDDIIEHWELTVEYVQISPIDDMLGEWGKGEEAAHAFEVRFPSEWYDAHTEGFPENVKMDRMLELQRWVISTDPDKATGDSIVPTKYGDTTYTNDTSDYRLAKFRAELGQHFNVEDSIFYYIFTELFLMIDSRVKNSFPTYFSITHKVPAKHADTGEQLYEETDPEEDVVEEGVIYFKRTGKGTEEDPYVYTEYPSQPGSAPVDESGNPLFVYLMTEEEDVDKDGKPLGRWCWFPYDMDTAIGINNEGLLVFDYSLEDTEGLKGSEVVPYTDPSGVPVYNGAVSVFWNNLRKTYQNEIQKQYSELRSGKFSYDTIETAYETHQNMWPAAVFNEDAYYKYILPLIDERHEDRTGMCLGSKEQQRKWWLYNRFRFIDSKYNAADAFNSTINFRVNDLGGDKTVQITPYADIYVKVKQGEQWQSTPVKTYRNKTTSVFIDVPQAGDTEAYIYSADQIKEVTGLNQSLHISTLDISKAVNLQHLDVSDPVKNETLAELSVGGNKLLRVINARNCYALGDRTRQRYSETVDLSQCEQLEEAYFDGTLLSTVKLPEGGRLRTVYLPSTITTLNIENQTRIQNIQILNNETHEWDTSNIETLIISNVNQEVQNIAVNIIEGLKDGSFLKFTGFTVDFNTTAAAKVFIDKLMKLNGIDVPDVATVFGTIIINDNTPLDYQYYATVRSKLKDLTINCQVKKTVEFYSYDGEVLLDTQYSVDQSEDSGHVEYKGSLPVKPDTEEIHYNFDGWSLSIGGEKEEDILNRVDKDYKLYAYFTENPIYTVRFYSYDGQTLLETHKTRPDLGSYVIFEGEFPKAPEGYTAEFEGWGTIPYGGVDIQDEENHRKIINITQNLDIFTQMDWAIKSLEVSRNPNKMNYYAGEIFDPEGMILTALKVTPLGEIPATVIVYSYEKTPITFEHQDVIITVKNLQVSVTVNLALEMNVSKNPVKFFFDTGKPVDLGGLQLTTLFTHDQKEVIDYNEKAKEIAITPETYEDEGYHDLLIFYKGISCTFRALFVKYISRILEENTWATISAVSSEGLAQNYWAVGDEKHLYISPDLIYGFVTDIEKARTFRIVAFDHNKDLESPDQHTITFGIAKGHPALTTAGARYEVMMSSNCRPAIDMDYQHSWNKGCLLRDYCGYVLGCFPEELKPLIKEVTKGQSDQDWSAEPLPPPGHETWTENVYSTICKTQKDKVFIPSLCELTGQPRLSDQQVSDESTVCKQFEYYKLGTAETRKKCYDGGTSDMQWWWTRSFTRDQSMYISSTGERVHNYEYALIQDTGVPRDSLGTSGYGFAPFFNI